MFRDLCKGSPLNFDIFPLVCQGFSVGFEETWIIPLDNFTPPVLKKVSQYYQVSQLQKYHFPITIFFIPSQLP